MTLRSLAVPAAVGAAALGLVAAGCGGGSSSYSTATGAGATAGTAPAAGPSVSIVSPADGASVSQPVTLRARLTDFHLSAADVGKPAKTGEGHLHWSMDGGRYDVPKYSGANGALAVKLGVQGKYSPSVTPTITYRNLPAGRHTVVVYLANNDHSSVGPTATTSFTVAGAGAAGPSVSFVAPATGASVASPVTARVKLSGFHLSAADVGKPAKTGEGHLHFSMDGGTYDVPKYSGANGALAVKLGVQGKYSPSVTPTITYRSLPAGTHTLVVHLANNDHSDVGPTATTTFTVR